MPTTLSYLTKQSRLILLLSARRQARLAKAVAGVEAVAEVDAAEAEVQVPRMVSNKRGRKYVYETRGKRDETRADGGRDAGAQGCMCSVAPALVF